MIELQGADLFCGAGGFTTGTEDALAGLGLKARLRAVNHWPLAIETHRRNHPTVDHYVQDVTLVEPLSIVPGGYLDFLMASPECTYHSTARGGRPIHDQKRMDPWAVVRWLTNLDVRILIVENVPEFVNWGPLCTRRKGHPLDAGADDEQRRKQHDHTAKERVESIEEWCNRPDPRGRGLYFEAWYNAIAALGYAVEWKTLNAADFGDATTRVRFFMQARKDGRSICWPEPTHARKPSPMESRLKWRAAREVIDWTRRRPSIFDRAKPLSENTRKRMAEGFRRFAGPLAPLYIELLDLVEPGHPGGKGGDHVKPDSTSPSPAFVMGKQSNPIYRSTDEPIPTLTTQAAPSLVEPVADHLVDVNKMVSTNRNNNVPRPDSEPVPVVTSAPGGGLYAIELEADAFVLGQQSCSAPRTTDAPIPTIATAGAIALIEPIILPYYRTGVAHGVDDPLHTQTAKARFGLTQALVVPYGPTAEARDVDEPMHTITTKDRLALAEAEPQPFLMQGAPHTKETAGVRSIDDPLYTVVTNPRLNVVEGAAFLVPHFNERDGQSPRVHDLEEPAPTVTSRGAGNLVEGDAVIVQTDQTGSNGACVRSVTEPLFTQPTGANQALAEGIVTPVLLQVNHGDDERSGSRVRSVDDPTWTTSTHRNVMLAEPIVEAIQAGVIDRRRLVIIDDQLCMLDIRYGMLENDELARAMGFTNEERTYEFAGNKGEVTKQIGNAVAVGVAKALLTAALGHDVPREEELAAG